MFHFWDFDVFLHMKGNLVVDNFQAQLERNLKMCKMKMSQENAA